MDKVNNSYTLACKDGVLEERLQRPYISTVGIQTPSTYMLDSVLENWKSMPQLSQRQLITSLNRTGQQGQLHCNCKKGCSSKRCSCIRANVKCNSRCHAGITCSNRD